MIAHGRSMPGVRGARAYPLLGGKCGSAVLLMLFVCLVIAVVLQGLSTVILCVERALADESNGRTLLAQKDAALAGIRQDLLEEWGPLGPVWTTVSAGSTEVPVEVAAAEMPQSEGWTMAASVRHNPSVSRWLIAVDAERGRDGIDLPFAAVVAGRLEAVPEREATWVDLDLGSGVGGGDPVLCFVREPVKEPFLGSSCTVSPLATRWQLDPGWELAAVRAGDDSADGTAAAGNAAASEAPSRGFAPGERTHLLSGRSGQQMALPAGCGADGPDAPYLLLVTGGPDLDARERGDFYGVIVVDGGSLLLEGTVVHGAVFATETISLGERGRVLFARETLRWATDRSLHRVRLVPGTRREDVE